MDKKLMQFALAMLATPFIFTACSDDNDDDNNKTELVTPADEDDLAYGTDGVWTGWNQNINLNIDDLVFAHSATDYDGWMYSTGYVAAKSTDNNYYEDMYNHQFTVMPAGGVKGTGTPYIVAFWQSYEETDPAKRSTAIWDEDSELFTPKYTYVTNTCYAYYTMQLGNAFSKKFQEGDWFKLVAHGVKLDGSETTAEFYLANCQGAEESWIVKDWQKWDLSALGQVKLIYFTMESSDTGDYGMNTPAYFALDNIAIAD